MESFVVCCGESGGTPDVRIVAEPANRDIADALSTDEPPESLWILLVLDLTRQVHTENYSGPADVGNWWSRSPEILKEFARIRQFKCYEIKEITGGVPELPEESPREICVTNLRIPDRFVRRPRKVRTARETSSGIIDRLRDAGLDTLGAVVDAGWDGLGDLGLQDDEIERVDEALALFELELNPGDEKDVEEAA